MNSGPDCCAGEPDRACLVGAVVIDPRTTQDSRKAFYRRQQDHILLLPSLLCFRARSESARCATFAPFSICLLSSHFHCCVVVGTHTQKRICRLANLMQTTKIEE